MREGADPVTVTVATSTVREPLTVAPRSTSLPPPLAMKSAAAEAARAASIARSAGEAAGGASAAASASLTNQGVKCASQSVSIDAGAFGLPIGTPGVVSATVTCMVDMSDLSLPGIPGSRTLTHTSTSPLDTYRGRQG